MGEGGHGGGTAVDPLLSRISEAYGRLQAERDALAEEVSQLRASLEEIKRVDQENSESPDVECVVVGDRVFQECAEHATVQSHHFDTQMLSGQRWANNQHNFASFQSTVDRSHTEISILEGRPEGAETPPIDAGESEARQGTPGLQFSNTYMNMIHDDLHESRMSRKDRVAERGVSARYVKEYLHKELNEAGACLQLPWALLLFAAFTSAFWAHQQVERLHAMDNAVSFDILENANFAFSGAIPFENGRMGHKSILDVNSYADFWSWLNLGLVPIFWPEGWDINEARTNIVAKCVGEAQSVVDFGWDASEVYRAWPWGNGTSTQDCPETGMSPPVDFYGSNPRTASYLYYNGIVGGARLQQERLDHVPCPSIADDGVRQAVRGGKCVPDPGNWLEPERHQALREAEELVDKPHGRTQYLLSGLGQQDIRRQLRELENQVWLSPETRKVEILFTTYNKHEDIFTATFVLFFINRGGHIHKMINPVSMWLHPYMGWYNYAFDGLWLILVFKLFMEEFIEVLSHWKRFGLRAGTAKYLCFSNAVDWLSVLYSAAIVTIWMLHLNNLEEIREFLRRADATVPGTWSDPNERSRYFDAVATTVRTSHIFRYVLAFYPFVIISRFFKACYAQPRLSVVMMTFKNAMVDLAHFLIIFCALLAVYALSALILFGQELLEFANIGRCFTTVCRILLGDFDWERMHQVGRLQAGIWLGTFMAFVNLVILNMLLAIIMDIYTEVKGNIGSDAETLPSQAVEIYERWRAQRRGEQVPLEYMIRCIDGKDFQKDGQEVGDDEMLTTSRFQELVPRLQEEQASAILQEALARKEAKERAAMSMAEAMLKVQDVNAKVEQLLSISMADHRGKKQQRASGSNGGGVGHTTSAGSSREQVTI